MTPQNLASVDHYLFLLKIFYTNSNNIKTINSNQHIHYIVIIKIFWHYSSYGQFCIELCWKWAEASSPDIQQISIQNNPMKTDSSKVLCSSIFSTIFTYFCV